MQFGALVAIEPSTGRVLAFAEKVGNPKLGIPRPALSAQHPAASVFKLVSAAALLTEAGIKPSRRVCVHGGRRRLGKREIEGDPRRDRRCRRFGTALGHSDNSVFARLAYTELEPAALARVAEDFGFGGAPDLPWPVEPSTFDLPSDDLHEYARAAAGFWHSKLSPAHAASMTAALANRGVVMRVHHVDTWMAADGSVRYRAEPTATGRVVDKRTAGVLTRMMVETTTKGTARKIFSGKHWPWRRSLEVAGKTGSLTRRKPTTVAYSWFVGFAPADDPEIAVAALVANGDRWWIKAGHLARTSLAAWRRSRRGPKNRGQRS